MHLPNMPKHDMSRSRADRPRFSSNVVEKCIRVADPEIRKSLVAEVLNRSRLEKLLRDSYGNYVIQTILDYCDMGQRMVVSLRSTVVGNLPRFTMASYSRLTPQLIECIRPILPSIRNTPYGKRIQSKLAREDSSFANGPFTPRGGFRGGYGGDRGSSGPVHRHLGRPQLQHINALTEVYGSHGGPFVQSGPGSMGYGMPHGGFRPNGAPSLVPDHTGMSFHAPGPDGAPWLHLRGPSGGPAPNWNAPGSMGIPDMNPDGVNGGPQGHNEQEPMWQHQPNDFFQNHQHHQQATQAHGVPMM